MLRDSRFMTAYEYLPDLGTIHFGAVGRVYLVYLLLGIVLIGYNFEKTYRLAPAEFRYNLRLPYIGIYSALAFFTFILATGVLYSSIGMGKLIASSLPIILASATIAHAYLRGALTDASATVSRSVVYSSFTALAAALFVLSIGAAAQIAPLTRWSPDEILIVATGVLVVLVALLFLFSNRFQRSLRRYIDRNFYVNRYDYRTQWFHLAEALQGARDRDLLFRRASEFLREAFVAEEITISLRSVATGDIRPVFGKGADRAGEILRPDSPLFRILEDGRKSLLLDRRKHDLTYIPIYAEDDRWLEGTASRMIAPLTEGPDLIGTLGLERKDPEDAFTYEDVALLDSIAAHVSAAVRCLELSEELAASREVELLSQWSSMLLHDLKNYLTPLRLVSRNLVENAGRPDRVTACAADISEVVGRMEGLVQRLKELRRNDIATLDHLCPNEIVRDALARLHVTDRSGIQVKLNLEATQSILGDRDLLRRVMENLITNALEAVDGSGTLSISTEDERSNGSKMVRIEVVDTGTGMDEAFIRERLFRPFVTTKANGLGIGIPQCRSIVRAHGGEISVKSELGKGTTFRVILQGAAR
jgi:putative PEP-CTERM system histidine kinase